MKEEILVLSDTKLLSRPDWQYDNVPLFANLERIAGRHRWYHNQDHSRWVYKDAKNSIFIKVWNHTYVRRDNLLMALEADFYKDLIPAFKGVIRKDNVCRGYVMDCCEKPNNLGNKYKEILKTIKDNTKRTNLFAYDFHEGSVMLYGGKPCLIDLEGVYHLDDYERLKKEYEDLKIGKSKDDFIKDKEYEKFILSLLKKNSKEL